MVVPRPGRPEGYASMLAKLKTFSLVGIDALPVEVEVDVSPAGLPKVVLVGLPEAAVKESTHRVEAPQQVLPALVPSPAGLVSAGLAEG